MTLAEMSVTLFISSVVAVGVATLMSFAGNQLFIVIEKSVTEENLLTGAYFLRFYLSQAVGINGVAGAIGTPGGGGVLARGMIRDDNLASATTGYDSAVSPGSAGCGSVCGAAGAPDGTVDLIAAFAREAGPNSVAAGQFNSQFRDTAIFFQRPLLGSASGGCAGGRICKDQGWGRIYIDVGQVHPLGYAGAATDLQVGLKRIVINRLVRLQVNVTQGPLDVSTGYQGARFAVLNLTARYFRTTNQANWRWCDPIRMTAAILGCETLANYRDIDLAVNVGFRNNVLRPNSLTTPGVPDRLFGSLYFFKPTTPQVSF